MLFARFLPIILYKRQKSGIFDYKMNERFRLNAELIRAHLEREHRKLSWLEENLKVSDSLVNKMLGGRVPKKRTLKKLAALLGVAESDLLIPREEAA